MKHPSYRAVLILAFVLTACVKKDETEAVPPGFCQTQVECQPTADRQNATQQQLEAGLRAQGVHQQYLPCGKYEVTKAPNGFWAVTRYTTGCPSTASQQDPNPDPTKTKPVPH